MLRNVGDAERCSRRQRLDAALALGQMLDDFESIGMAERTSDAGELRLERAFGVVFHYASHYVIQ